LSRTRYVIKGAPASDKPFLSLLRGTVVVDREDDPCVACNFVVGSGIGDGPKWGLASYHKDTDRTMKEALAQCNKP